jgi:proteasome beta subunit
LATAGLVGDLQVLARYLNAEANLYRLKREINMPVKSAATLMSNILNSRKFYPYYVQLVLGGFDDSGGHVYSLDAAGGAIPDNYTSGGSGSPYVYGVLEDNYKDDLTIDEGIDIAIRAITAAMNRDSASGGMIDIAIITKDGFQALSKDEVKKRIEKIAK